MILDYKVKKLIQETLETTLSESKKRLSDMQKDESCSAQNYEYALDRCKEIEYAIQQMEKQI